MPKRKFKTHLAIGPTHTYCGRDIMLDAGWKEKGWKPIDSARVTSDLSAVNCSTCRDAYAASQR